MTAIDGSRVKLRSGGELEADLVVVGVGVRPRTELAAKAGLTIDRGVVVNATSRRARLASSRLATSPAGQIPTAAKAFASSIGLLPSGKAKRPRSICSASGRSSTAVPFFWSQHYDVAINYVGHAEKWDELTVDGDIAAKDCLLRYKRNGRVLAVASIYRDLENLKAELEMELDAAA